MIGQVVQTCPHVGQAVLASVDVVFKRVCEPFSLVGQVGHAYLSIGTESVQRKVGFIITITTTLLFVMTVSLYRIRPF